MSDILDFALMGIENRYNTAKTKQTDDEYVSWRDEERKTGTTDLSFEDMLLLMVTQFQNQSIDNQADTNDMMNQLIQMTVMQAMTEVSTQVKELTTANVMSYAASLVGKEVTLGVYDEKGNIVEKVGVVQGTGTYNGAQVIFVDGESYFLSSIMGVGRLPEMNKPGDGDGDTDSDGDDDKVEGGDQTEGTDKPEGGGETEGSGSTEGAENSGAAGETGGTPGGETGGSNSNNGETEVAGASGTEGI